jgi:hypothetical protein
MKLTVNRCVCMVCGLALDFFSEKILKKADRSLCESRCRHIISKHMYNAINFAQTIKSVAQN